MVWGGSKIIREVDPMEKREPKRDEYKGNPLLVLPLADNREFSFGLGKARAILEFIEAVRCFVREHERPAPQA